MAVCQMKITMGYKKSGKGKKVEIKSGDHYRIRNSKVTVERRRR
jgi:hypothetical protein